MAKASTKIELWPVSRPVAYENNAKIHPIEQVEYLAKILDRHGFDQPIVVDKHGVIIKGHGRLLAAKHLGLEKVPVVVRDDLTPAQAAEARIADNRVAELGDWDTDLVLSELTLFANDAEFDATLTGFNFEELTSELALGENYSRKIESPVYEPTQKKPPPVGSLCDTSKTDELLAELESAELPLDLRVFLQQAAARHTAFDYEQIAEFYAHASAPVKLLMERSALVIVDYQQAIEHGFVQMTKELAHLAQTEDDATA